MQCWRTNFATGSNIVMDKDSVVDIMAAAVASTTAIGFEGYWPSFLDPRTMGVSHIIAFAVKVEVAISIVVNIFVEVFEAIDTIVGITAEWDTGLVEELTVAVASGNCLASISFELRLEAFTVAATKLLADMLIAFLNLNYYIKNIF